MFSNPLMYSQNHNLTTYDTEDFLKTTCSKMDWKKQDEDVVMDLGCGPGFSCLHLLLPSFPSVKKIIAVDVLPSMIDFAKTNNSHPKIDYFLANIEDSTTMEVWTGKISKVISIYCFNWLNDQRRAFENIYNILKPGGEAALFFSVSATYWETYELHIVNPKWNAFLKGVNQYVPESHFKGYSASHYNKMVNDIGFEVVSSEVESREYIFNTDDECKGFLMVISALPNHIPPELRNEFKEDLFDAVVKRIGRNKTDGRPFVRHRVLLLHIRKPKNFAIPF